MAKRAVLYGADRGRRLKGRWMGLAVYSTKIPRLSQFTDPDGLHGGLLMDTKKPADPGGRRARGGSLGAQSGVVRVNVVSVM
jgi:hypothetical protein